MKKFNRTIFIIFLILLWLGSFYFLLNQFPTKFRKASAATDEPNNNSVITSEKIEKAVTEKLLAEETTRVLVKLEAPKSLNIAIDDFSDRRYIDTFQAGVVNEIGLAQLVNNRDVKAVYLDQPVVILGTFDPISFINADLTKYGLNYSGRGQKICILDTGLDYTSQSSLNFQAGYNFINNSKDPFDDYGHGSTVTNLLAKVAPAAELYVAKVINKEGRGLESTVLAGLQWCIDQSVDIINFSIGSASYDGFCDNNPVAQLVNKTVGQGIYVVAATGNEGSQKLKSPSCATSATRVSASDYQDHLSPGVNVNLLVDLLAPSESSTSYSAPLVAGAAALLLEKESFSPASLTYRLRSTGVPIDYTQDGQTIHISRLDVYSALKNIFTMEPFRYQGGQSSEVGDRVYMTLASCGKNPTCSNIYSCCYSDGTCRTSSTTASGWSCVDCDTYSDACAKCCQASGSSGTACTSTYYTGFTWFSTASKCCGDDGSTTDTFDGSSTDGCCCAGTQIATGNDAICASNSNYWCIDGTYCTTGSGLVRDTSLTAGGETYAITGDTVVCGCDSSGNKCDTNDADATTEGICATSTCDTDIVMFDGASTYSSTCNSSGNQCDSDVTPTATTPRYVTEGACAGSTCDLDEVCNDESTYQTDCSSCSSASTDVDACDSDTDASGYVSDGYCTTGGTCSTGIVYNNSGTLTDGCTNGSGEQCDSDAAGAENGAWSTYAEGACVSGSACDTDQVCNNEGTYTSDCSGCSSASTDIDACDTDVDSSGYSAIGYCTTGGTCSTGIVYNNSGTLTDGCTNGGGQQCDSDAAGSENGAWSSYADGACVSGSTCDTTDVCVNTGTYYGTMASCSDNDACDSDVDSSGYTRDGYVCNTYSLNCVVDGTRTAGQSCCTTANCGGGLLCTSNTCQAVSYTPKSQNWRWYDDEWDCDSSVSTHDAGQTCANSANGSALANENTVATGIGTMNAIKLRATINETGGAEGANVKMRIQYAAKVGGDCNDGDESFANVAAKAATGTPWRYYDSTAGTDDSDNTTLGANRLSDSGSNKATHNDVGDSATTFDHTASTAFEWEFTIQNYNGTANTSYCFRIYDNTNAAAVSTNTGETLPELTTTSAYDLSLSAPASVNMSGYQLGSGGTDTDQFSDKDVSIWDRRGTGAGWALSATSNDLISGSRTIPNDDITWTTNTIKAEYAENTSCAANVGVCAGSGAFSGTVTLMDADADTSGPSAPGWGGYVIDVWTMSIVNLENKYTGTYTGIMTLTIL